MTKSSEFFTTIARVKKLIIRHPQFEQAYQQILSAYEMNCQVKIPQHLICVGESGTGKSTIKQELEKAYPPCLVNDIPLIPILVIDTPALPTVKNLAEAVLVKLGDPLFSRGSAIDKTHRIQTLFKACGVKLVIFDELQHFIDQGKTYNTLKVADWLKTLIDNTQVSTVLMGLERSEQILQVNEQLRRRFSRRIDLKPFDLEELQDWQYFIGILKKIDQEIALPNPLVLTDKVLVRRIHFATHGIIDYMVKLLLGAYEVAYDLKLLGIDQHCLEIAFTKRIWGHGTDHLNPFNKAFKWQRLDKTGMPFHKSIVNKLEVKP